MPAYSFALKPLQTARTLWLLAGILVTASVLGQLIKYVTGHGSLFGLVPLFYVDCERNIPTIFGTTLLLIAGVLLAAIARLKSRDRDAMRWAWRVLAFGFFLMAADEAYSLHEQLVEPTRRLLGGGRLGMLYFTWVVPGIAAVLVLGGLYLRFLFRLPARTRIAFCVAASLYLGGVLGMELVGGAYAERHGLDSLAYSMIATIEESLEMAGLIVFIHALLAYFAAQYGEIRLRFGDTCEYVSTYQS